MRTIGYLLRYADEIVVLDSGQLVDKGSLEDLMARSTYIQGLQTSLLKPTSSIDSRPSETVMTTPFSVEQGGTAEERTNEAVPSENDDLLDHEAPSDLTRRNGDPSVYTYYVKAGGRTTVVISLVLIMAWSFCRDFSSKSPFNHSSNLSLYGRK